MFKPANFHSQADHSEHEEALTRGPRISPFLLFKEKGSLVELSSTQECILKGSQIRF